MIYLILQNPGHNRVYYDASESLALAELRVASKKLDIECIAAEVKFIQGIRYLSLETASEISDSDLQVLSRLSFIFALYEVKEIDSERHLLPIKIADYRYFDDKISSILKYQGKTNELFTRMMINLGILSSRFSYSEVIKLLDPVAGKGTTLFESLIYGYESYGIEIDVKAVQELNIYFKKFLENERYKHSSDKKQISGKNKSEAVYLHEYAFSKTKEAFKSDEGKMHMGIVNGQTQGCAAFFKNNSFHLLVGDLPYGIQHENSKHSQSLSGSRNPYTLLAESLPEWKKVLMPGGTIVLAWNSYLISRKKMTELFESNGLEVFQSEEYLMLEHMVDKAIKRDVIVGTKG